MAGFGSIGEFRAALNTLVAQTKATGAGTRRKKPALPTWAPAPTTWIPESEPVRSSTYERQLPATFNPAAASIEHAIRQGSNRDLDRDVVWFGNKLKEAKKGGDAWGIEWWGDRLTVAKDEIKKRKKSGAWTAGRKARANTEWRVVHEGENWSDAVSWVEDWADAVSWVEGDSGRVESGSALADKAWSTGQAQSIDRNWRLVLAKKGSSPKNSTYNIEKRVPSYDELQRRADRGYDNPARKNMAVRMLPGGIPEFDTPGEMAEWQRIQSGGVAPVKAPRVSGGGGGRSPARREFKGQLKDPGGPPTYGQAKAIGLSIGGIASYCPTLVGQKVAGGAHVQALAQMGLTAAKASAVCDAMQRAGVFYGRTPEQVAQARQILTEVGGVVCAANNPWAFRAKRNMAGRPRQFGLPAAKLGDPAMSKFSAAELKALGTLEAQLELARREHSRLLRAGVAAPAARAAKRGKKARRAKKNPVDWTRSY